MSHIRPFWERHPWLIRPAAIALLIVSPIVFPTIAIVLNWGRLSDDILSAYRECWSVAKRGLK